MNERKPPEMNPSGFRRYDIPLQQTASPAFQRKGEGSMPDHLTGLFDMDYFLMLLVFCIF